MESIEEFLGIDVIDGGLLIGEGDTVSSVELGGSLLFDFFGRGLDMGVRVDLGGACVGVN